MDTGVISTEPHFGLFRSERCINSEKVDDNAIACMEFEACSGEWNLSHTETLPWRRRRDSLAAAATSPDPPQLSPPRARTPPGRSVQRKDWRLHGLGFTGLASQAWLHELGFTSLAS